MKPVRIVLFGAGGYGVNYTSRLRQLLAEKPGSIDIRGVVDPFVEKAAHYGWIRESGFPLYSTPEEFYAADNADLALIATPIPLHSEQCIYAMRHGSNVLVEKPLCPTVQEARELETVSRETGRFLAVGFQWSFSRTMTDLKRDILAGKFGKPVAMRSYVTWKRNDRYYHDTWRGRYKDRQGRWTLDCVLTNATAHYLHNLFFVNGPAFDEAAMPLQVKAESYSVKADMETPDVFVMRGTLPGGIPFWYGCSYSLAGDQLTFFEYEFENAVVRFNLDRADEHVRALFRDGSSVDYGDPGENVTRKIDMAIARVNDPEAPLPCVVKTVMPHLLVADGILEKCWRKPVPEELIVRQPHDGVDGTFALKIRDSLIYAMAKDRLPSELGYDWAENAVEFRPDDITFFPGIVPVNREE